MSHTKHPAPNDAAPAAAAQPRTVFRLNGLWVAYAHSFFATSAFLSALVTGCLLHYNKIVTNEYFTYPLEWFPSVSATIGDRYPERSVYQLLIALTSSSRFVLCFLTYYLTNAPGARLPFVLLIVGVLRTFSCGGWTYVTSTDDHDSHDIFMILYIVLTLPYTIMRTVLTPKGTRVRTLRIVVASLFFGAIVPLVYLFIQHKVHRVPGAYTIYAFVEWSLVFLDILFDSLAAYDLPSLEIVVQDLKGVTKTSSEVALFAEPEKVFHASPPRLGFVISVLNWFVWWSVVTSIGAMVWYFPLWYMDVSGYEAYLLALASPALLAVPPLRKLFESLPQLAFAGQVVGVLAYWEPSPQKRMMLVGIGSGFASIALATVFRAAARSARPKVLESQAAAFVIGLLVTVVVRIPAFTNNPIWPIMNSTNGGQNHWGVALGLFGALFAGTMVPEQTRQPQPRTSSVLSGLGLGAALFFALTYMTDISNVPLWVWEGYPVHGPVVIPHGVLVVFTMVLGLLYGLRENALGVPKLLVFGGAMAVLSQVKHFAGFAAGLVAVFYVTAVLPALLRDAAQHHPAKSFGIGLFTMILYYFAETWTVAYAFVPGGWLLRERTWVVMASELAFIALGVLNAKPGPRIRPGKLVYFFLLALSASASLFTYSRYQSAVVPQPWHPQTNSFNAGIWTIHFALDNGLWASEERMANLIREAELDVVGLLETDTQRVVNGHRDMTQKLAETLGYYSDYGPTADKHTWGCALLSKFPIVASSHHLTPSPVGELAPAILATLDVYGELVDVAVFHSGQEEDPEDRAQQTAYMSDLLGSTGSRPTILLSYLVTKPLVGNYNTWVSERSGMRDIDPTDDDRWCEYILYKNLRRVAYARISRDSVTDTELQVGKFQIGAAPNYSNQRIAEHDVDPDLRMPALFRGNGVRGHRYHVFDEPRYYA